MVITVKCEISAITPYFEQHKNEMIKCQELVKKIFAEMQVTLILKKIN
jgi:hypothetical protein